MVSTAGSKFIHEDDAPTSCRCIDSEASGSAQLIKVTIAMHSTTHRRTATTTVDVRDRLLERIDYHIDALQFDSVSQSVSQHLVDHELALDHPSLIDGAFTSVTGLSGHNVGVEPVKCHPPSVRARARCAT
jgi:hypothetical protein